ncbi:flagellar export protein FliJ [Gracilinema caldarium]|uniref:Flagellar FliJ protein n=1 Tax=Gracilinema caldarium (strain ATCC 51460 / DSM 7334 / H1) TaxID=744872 RepID=F8F1W2_GRAC1|nr:flagellar export protein FliJ [Gracilinema caldarium]AEJ19809.1 flagellar export protein FliJ [Gracilinema caldarium DSM 7334]
MKRFRFHLDKLLELRLYYEGEAELALAKAMGELQSIQNRLEQLAEERAEAAAERFRPGRTVAQIQATDLYILRLDKTKESLLEAAARAELVVAEKRQAYLDASRDRKVLDKLKEKRQKEYKYELSLEEIKIVDDISSGSRARKNTVDGD